MTRLPVLQDLQDSDVKCGCGKPGVEGNTCPYSNELYGKVKECNCCFVCYQECKNDI